MGVALEPGETLHAVHVITDELCMKGTLRVKGALEVILNSEDRFTMSLVNVEVQALDPNNTAAAMHLSSVVLPKASCQLILFDTQPSADDLTVKPVLMPSVVYTARFALQGTIRVGGAERLADVLEALKGHFLPLFKPRLYPLVHMWAVVPRAVAVALVNKNHVRMMHEAV